MNNQDSTSKTSIEPLWVVEKRTIEKAITFSGGNVRLAARHLEVAPSTLYRKLLAWENVDDSANDEFVHGERTDASHRD